MIKKLLCLVMLVCIIAVFTCCNNTSTSSAKEQTVTVINSDGNEVTVPKNPRKTAVLFSSFADIWVSAGGTVDITVGESVERGFADTYAVLVDSAAGKTIDNEALIAQKPDLVIASADIKAQTETATLCQNAGIPVLTLRVEDFEDYLRVLKSFTVILDNPENYKTYGEDLTTKIESLLKNNSFDGKKILFIRAGSGAKTTKAKVAKDHFAAAMLKELGTVNIAENAAILLDSLSFEEILINDPDYIFISTMGDENAAKAYMSSVLKQKNWQSLTAVKKGKVFYLEKDLFQYKPNANWDKAYARLIELMK